MNLYHVTKFSLYYILLRLHLKFGFKQFAKRDKKV